MKPLIQSLAIAALLSAAVSANDVVPVNKGDSSVLPANELANPPVIYGKENSNRAAAVPEPSVIVPLVCGLGALILLGRRRG